MLNQCSFTDLQGSFLQYWVKWLGAVLYLGLGGETECIVTCDPKLGLVHDEEAREENMVDMDN